MLDGLKTSLFAGSCGCQPASRHAARGIEKEGLRVLRDGRISQSNHPEALGLRSRIRILQPTMRSPCWS